MSCLTVQNNTRFLLNNFYLSIESHLGKFADIDYYQVVIQEVEQSNANTNLDIKKLGLLRIGNINGGLSRELQLRHVLGENNLISELLTFGVEAVDIFSNNSYEQRAENSFNSSLNGGLTFQTESVIKNIINISSYTVESTLHQSINNYQELSSEGNSLNESWESTENYEYLEDESTENTDTLPNKKLLLLSYLPTERETLDVWLRKKLSHETALELTYQICKLFQQIHQQGWCIFQIIPPFIQVGSTTKFFDLSNVSLIGEKPTASRETEYCAPEIAFNCPISEGMSTYIIGTLLYQAIYQQLPDTKINCNLLDIQPIPGIYQIINLCLSPILEERISIAQLLKALNETKQTFSNYKVQWNVSSRSTIGLSRQRLHNEDSYGVQHYSSSYKDGILAVLADGMGGLAQGELASQLAVKTVIETPIDCLTDNEDQCDEWLVSVVKKANKCVIENVHKGGTTLSVVWADSRFLRIAHVGDSRIYLIRKKMICQLSEDHSLVSMLLANGEISYQESHQHRQRNILTKCIGIKETLDSGYVQTLQVFASNSIFLEQDDIIILCSDGVWDLVYQTELAEIFTGNRNLKIAVNNTINLVLSRGARDNATIIAMKCSLLNQY